MTDPNYYKYINLPESVKAMKRNQSSDRINLAEHSNEEVKTLKKRSIAKHIDNKIFRATHSMWSLPDEHIATFNEIWFSLLEQIEDYSRTENLDDDSVNLLEKLINSDVYQDSSQITSRQEIVSKIRKLESIVKVHLK